MDRRSLIVSGLATGLSAAGLPALAQDQGDAPAYTGPAPDNRPAEPYTEDELARNVSDFFGVTAENAGALIERIFHDNGRPTAYIAGEEGSGAFFFGLRYGRGLM